MYLEIIITKRNWPYKSQKLHVCKLVIKDIDNVAVLSINRLLSIVSNIHTYPGRNLLTCSWLSKNFLTVPNGNNYISITKLRAIMQSIWPNSIFLFIKPLIGYPFVLSRELRKKIFTLHSLLYYAHSDRYVIKNKKGKDGKEKEREREIGCSQCMESVVGIGYFDGRWVDRNTFQYVPSFIERFLAKNPRRMQNLRHKVDQTANHKLPSIRIFWFYEFCTAFFFFSIYAKKNLLYLLPSFSHTSSFLNTIGLSYTKFALTFRYPN